MNVYGVATGTNAYSLNVSNDSPLRLGDVLTVRFLNGNTTAATLSVNGNDPLAIKRNGSALSTGQIASAIDYQLTFAGSTFVMDAGAGGSVDVSAETSARIAADTALQTSITANTASITANTTSITANTSAIAANTTAIAGKAAAPTGTPTGSKFYRDDGVLAVPASGVVSIASANLPYTATLVNDLRIGGLNWLRQAVTGIGVLGSNAQAYSSVIDTSKAQQTTFIFSSDQISAVNGVICEVSLDGTNYHKLGTLTSSTTAANKAVSGLLSAAVVTSALPAFMRLNWTNGATGLTTAPLVDVFIKNTAILIGQTRTLIQPTLLGNGGVYTSPSYDLGSSPSGPGIAFYVQSDQASATTGCVVQTSQDNSVWVDTSSQITFAANTVNGFAWSSGSGFRYVRLKYTNSTVTQTIFNVMVIQFTVEA